MKDSFRLVPSQTITFSFTADFQDIKHVGFDLRLFVCMSSAISVIKLDQSDPRIHIPHHHPSEEFDPTSSDPGVLIAKGTLAHQTFGVWWNQQRGNTGGAERGGLGYEVVGNHHFYFCQSVMSNPGWQNERCQALSRLMKGGAPCSPCAARNRAPIALRCPPWQRWVFGVMTLCQRATLTCNLHR